MPEPDVARREEGSREVLRDDGNSSEQHQLGIIESDIWNNLEQCVLDGFISYQETALFRYLRQRAAAEVRLLQPQDATPEQPPNSEPCCSYSLPESSTLVLM